ncbi:MAG: CHASE2 domain-containing protein [Pseudoxanthomonas sp.]
MNPSPPSRLKARTATALAAGALAALLVLSSATARVDAWCHDLFSLLGAPAPDPRIVVVAIDDASRSEIGAWPWSRRVHTRLVDRLTEAGAQAVLLDLLLTEPALYDPEGDALLARALRRNGRVVLPVQVENATIRGKPAVELLPIPEFVAAAATLGHADTAIDRDGVSRGVFLHAGVGSLHWPALGLALRDLRNRDAMLADPRDALLAADASANAWLRSDYRLIPLTRPVHGFRRVSYADVLAGRVDAATLRDRYVLVGNIATGKGEEIAVPGGVHLSEVEYHANVLNVLLSGRATTPMPALACAGLSALLASVPLLLAALSGTRRWHPLRWAMVATLLLSLALLSLARIWFPPLPALLALAVVAMVWRYRSLLDRRHRNQTDALTGVANRKRLDAALTHELQASRHHGQPLSLLLVDVDHFRQLVAARGAMAGDAALRSIADTLSNRARRPRDLVARIDSNQFAVMLPETSAHAAAAIATTLHVDLAGLHGKRGDPAAEAPPSVSIGIHTIGGGTSNAAAALSCAEAALYQARQLGRSRTFAYSGNTASKDASKTSP